MCTLEKMHKDEVGKEKVGQWSQTTLPALNIREDDVPWKKAQKLSQWFELAKYSASAVSSNYAVYVEWAVEEARANVSRNQQLVHRRGTPTIIPDAFREYDKRFVLSLLAVIPHRLREVMLGDMNDEKFSSMSIWEQLQIAISPGGQMEADSLQGYARNPGVANTPKEAVDMLKDWRSARRRMISVGVGDVSSMEQERTLKQIASSVIPKKS